MALATRNCRYGPLQRAQVGISVGNLQFPQSRFVADFVGTTIFSKGLCVVEPGLITLSCSKRDVILLVDV